MGEESKSELLEAYENDWGSFRVYERYLVAEPFKRAHAEGSDVGGFIDFLAEITTRHYGDLPFGYIGNRVNRNAGNPSLFHYARQKIPNWSAFAVVSYSVITKAQFPLESEALREMPHALFEDLAEAEEWMDGTIRGIREKR